jgi:hypothetical protein
MEPSCYAPPICHIGKPKSKIQNPTKKDKKPNGSPLGFRLSALSLCSDFEFWILVFPTAAAAAAGD